MKEKRLSSYDKEENSENNGKERANRYKSMKDQWGKYNYKIVFKDIFIYYYRFFSVLSYLQQIYFPIAIIITHSLLINYLDMLFTSIQYLDFESGQEFSQLLSLQELVKQVKVISMDFRKSQPQLLLTEVVLIYLQSFQ